MDGNLAMNSHFENMSEKDSNDMADRYIIVEGNKLISEFIGWRFVKPDEQDYYDIYFKERRMWSGSWQEAEDVLLKGHKFHESWDKLMPVVEKISDTPMEDFINEESEDGGYAYPITFGMRDEIGQWMVRFRGHAVHTADTFIQAAWEAVVDFIKWHNLNQ